MQKAQIKGQKIDVDQLTREVSNLEAVETDQLRENDSIKKRVDRIADR